MSSLSTHVLDTASGRPAAGLRITLTTRAGQRVAQDVTDSDGRACPIGADDLGSGDYVLRFDTAAYGPGFFPEVVIVFTIGEDRHYHVPLLLSPYGYSTYRGS